MRGSLVIAAALAVGLGRPGDPLRSSQKNGPQALEALAAVERRFATAAREEGWRAAFLQYFAEDSIALTPDPVSARERLKSRPRRPFSEEELTWEPKAGDIAASGELGWLTGPSTFIDHTAAQPKPSYGNYLSIWKKQPDGRWRVFIDLGTTVPAPVSFPTWFTHVTAAPRYRDPAGASSATSSGRDVRTRSEWSPRRCSASLKRARPPLAKATGTGARKSSDVAVPAKSTRPVPVPSASTSG